MSEILDHAWPREDGLRGLLSPFRGAPAFEIQLRDRRGRLLGNHGDSLMYLVYRELAEAAGLRFVDDPEEAEVLVSPPNGALLDRYSWPALLRARLRELPDIPFIIFPSSALFRSESPAHIFQRRKSPTLWILRESHSHTHLLEMWGSSLSRAGVELALDHDVVASGHGRVRGILEDVALQTGAKGSSHQAEAGRWLVAARLDTEAKPLEATSVRSNAARRVAVGAFKALPARLGREVRKRYTRGRQHQANAELLSKIEQAGAGPLPSQVSSPGSEWIDISSPDLVDFRGYAESILAHSTVVTNRLHVALPAASIGSTTFLIDSGYHKLRGVYERSLRELPNVHLISDA